MHGNLKQIGLGLLNYESRYGCFPPAYVADANGKPLYSWRVLLMAEIDRTDRWFGGQLAGGFHFDEPWDSPNNSKLHKLTPYTVWHCPSDPAIAGSNETNFVAVVGPGTMFPSDGTSRRLADVTDGPENTLIVVEVVNAGIHWMEPKELDWRTMSFRLNDGTRPSVSSNHSFEGSGNLGPHVLTVDDMVTKLPWKPPPGDTESPPHDRWRGKNRTRGMVSATVIRSQSHSSPAQRLNYGWCRRLSAERCMKVEPLGSADENLVLYRPCLHSDSVARRPPLRRGAGGVSPRKDGLMRSSGSAVLRGIVASAQRIGSAF